MIIDVNLQLPLGFEGIQLPADQALLELPPKLTCKSKQGKPMRHPLGVYNTSLSQVLKRGQRVVSLLNELPTDDHKRQEVVVQLLEQQDTFLDSLMEHLDDCHNITISLATDYSDQALTRSSQYQKIVDEYRNHVGHIVNHIKHLQGRLRPVEMTNGHISIVGYFVEGVTAEGALGPHVELHRGGHTAFSFARNLRFHTVGLVHVSSALADYVASCLGDRRKFVTAAQEKENDLAKFLQSVAALPAYVFPDEAMLDDWICLSIRPRRGRSRRQLRLKYPCDSQRPSFLKHGRVGASWLSDGTTRSFRAPYTGTEFWEDLVRVGEKRKARR